MLGRQPVPSPDAETSHPLHAADPGGELRAQEAGVSRLVGHPTHSGQTEVDCGGRVLPLLKIDPIPEDDGAVERERGSEQYHATNSRIA